MLIRFGRRRRSEAAAEVGTNATIDLQAVRRKRNAARDFSLLAVAVTSLILGAMIAFDGSGQSAPADRRPTREFAVQDDEPPTPRPTAVAPTATPPAPPSLAPVARLKIGAIGVDAAVVMLGVDPDGAMQSPKTAKDVGFYDFSAKPGYDGNSVFAAHVDFAGVGAAVFGDLRKVKPGDEVQVGLSDGTTYTYRVTSTRSLTSSEAPIEEIIGRTPVQSVTLITCDGTFNTKTHQYDRRLVVRAERVA